MTEPPVHNGVLETCERTADDEVNNFMYSMCGNGDISTQKCRLQLGGSGVVIGLDTRVHHSA